MSKLDIEVLKKLADKFTDYVHTRDNNSLPLNFIDGSGVLVSEEGYKEEIFDKAQDILKCYEWDESWIGTGNIKDRIFQVMDISSNLVNFNTQIDFKKHFVRNDNKLDPDTERIIYEIFKRNDDKHAFEHAVKEFGAKYPVLAYLFFTKDMTKYMPTSPKNFDWCFRQLNIDFKMSYNCSWENYSEFISIINEIKEALPNYLETSHELRLIDAHSFVWIIGEEHFIDWKESSVSADINTPLKPKRKIRKADGTVSYQCPRCNESFKKSSRCPECGQMIKE